MVKSDASRALIPRILVDSSEVEYFGFGHPVVDKLVRIVTAEHHAGAAAVRWFTEEAIPTIQSGWQFNWRIWTQGRHGKEWIYPVFVSDDGTRDDLLGIQLLQYSRNFVDERAPVGEESQIDVVQLQAAFDTAERAALVRCDELESDLRGPIANTFELERARLDRLYNYKDEQAAARLQSDTATRSRLAASDDPNDRRTLPIWEFNVRRAGEDIVHLRSEREAALQRLTESRDPNPEYSLLNAARIEVLV